MAPDPSDGAKAPPPPHPFDERWYVRSDNETLGPYEGWRVKELIEQGEIGRQTLIARVGASEWSAIKDIPVFNTLVRAEASSGARPPAGRATSPRGAPPNIETTGVHFAGFWIRVLAYLIDYVIINIVVIVISGAVGLLIGVIAALSHQSGDQSTFTALVGAIGVSVAILVVVIYYVKFNAGPWQATPGKRVTGIHIITVSGEPVSGWLAFGRYLAYMLSALPLCIGFMVVGWNEEKKGFHDMLCNTRVIYGKL
ncbi:MAG TPA: RDD family protein [Methylovirgula sp.]|jgi:uncharacterized RDD family membrane protein YckC